MLCLLDGGDVIGVDQRRADQIRSGRGGVDDAAACPWSLTGGCSQGPTGCSSTGGTVAHVDPRSEDDDGLGSGASVPGRCGGCGGCGGAGG